MLKILSAEQIRKLDAATIANEPVTSIDLMERACVGFTQWFEKKFSVAEKVGVVCGTGNNGGDGLGIARILQRDGYNVSVWVVRSGKESPDFTSNLSRVIKAGGIVQDIPSSPDSNIFTGCSVIIDAIFGSGLSRSVEGVYGDVIDRINNTPATRVAVDVPSGLLIDKPSTGKIVNADFTVTFQIPKLAFMFPENGKYVGEWLRIDIGLDASAIEEQQTDHYFITSESIGKKLHTRKKFSNKGDFGKALLISGSYGKMGACVLCARAALRAGVGLLTLHVPKKGYEIVQSTVPEAMVTIDKHEEVFTETGKLENFTTIGIGPGIGTADLTRAAFEKVLDAGKPMVIDADALNILSAHPTLMSLIPVGSILSPHPKEFERLVGKWSDDFDRLTRQKSFAAKINAVVILKGAHTSIALPSGEVYFNSTGNAGMAKGGSGDVLTGILTGLLAQGYSSADAAIVSVYLHGLAGDLGVEEKGMNSLISSDLVDFLPNAFKKTQVDTQ